MISSIDDCMYHLSSGLIEPTLSRYALNLREFENPTDFAIEVAGRNFGQAQLEFLVENRTREFNSRYSDESNWNRLDMMQIIMKKNISTTQWTKLRRLKNREWIKEFSSSLFSSWLLTLSSSIVSHFRDRWRSLSKKHTMDGMDPCPSSLELLSLKFPSIWCWFQDSFYCSSKWQVKSRIVETPFLQPAHDRRSFPGSIVCLHHRNNIQERWTWTM